MRRRVGARETRDEPKGPSVVTPDEIGQIDLFDGLAPAVREQLARVAADIRLTPGEFAVHEGDPRALLAVLEGRVDTIRRVDGIERVVGRRVPGDSCSASVAINGSAQ